ncbi:MAG: hypothetical protein GX136_02520 [Clostridiales bacterium]|nr:hypothetical protein [Clostridiales bacterium]
MKKEPVTVEADKLPDGMLIPKAVLWKDGRRFEVTRVLYYSASPTGEYDGIRYTVIIGSAEKYIYRVNHKWYVMALSGGEGGEEIHHL